MLRLGLRRSETALLAADSLKDETDSYTGEGVFWLNVVGTRSWDPRLVVPRLKTPNALRQLPVPRDLVTVFDIYVGNYRRRADHPFLLCSQKGGPLSLRTFHDIFRTVSACLSDEAMTALKNRGMDSLSAHDLRHTAAVGRLKAYVDNGDDLDKAVEKLRVFFGWAPGSDMPRHYARAYFETPFAEIWNETFDEFANALRATEGVL